MAAIDLNRGTSGVTLPKSISNEVWKAASQDSAIMKVARRISLPGNGLSIPTTTAQPTAAWVNESEEKPVSRPTISSKNIAAYMLAVIVPFSNQLKRDMDALYRAIVEDLPNALAKTFDQT